MEATDIEREMPAIRQSHRAGWLLGLAGLGGMSWWIWTWSKVQTLIDTHVSTYGPVPASAMERAALYANGTPAEQQLSQDLASMSGLYPWGPVPLILAVMVALVGFFGARRDRKVLASLGVGITALLLVISLGLFDGTITVALDILE